MINGAHAIIYSADAEADRAVLRDVLGLPSVDTGDGWLIFGLPPSEIAVHPADAGGRHEVYFLVDDVAAFVAEMRRRKISCSAIHNERWGRITELTLPGGGTIGVYQPLHARPPAARVRRSTTKTRSGATTRKPKTQRQGTRSR